MDMQIDRAAHYEDPQRDDGHSHQRTFRESLALPVEELRIRDIAAQWLRRRGICTVRELVAVRPADIRRHVSSTRHGAIRRAITLLLGCEWEVARQRMLALPKPDPTPPQTVASPKQTPKSKLSGEPLQTPQERWETLRYSLTDEGNAQPLRAVPGLKARMIHYGQRAQIDTVGALFAVPFEALVGVRNLGSKTISDTVDAVHAWALARYLGPERRPAPPAPPPAPPWEELGLAALIDAMLARVSPRERGVIAQRMRTNGQRLTQGEIGAALGVSESRVSQIQREAAEKMIGEREGVELLVGRLRAALGGEAQPLAELAARDPWLAPLIERWSIVDIALSALPERAAYTVKINDALCVATFPQATVDDALRAASADFASMPAPLEDEHIEAIVARRSRGMGAVVEGALREKLRASRRPPVHAPLTRVGIRSVLRASPTPVRCDAFGQNDSGNHWPDEAVLLSDGRVTLVERFDGFDELARLAVPLCAAWIHAHGPDSAWQCTDLTVALRDLALPSWFDPRMLTTMARRVGGLRYVARDRLALPLR